jgi:hypothetical protein
MTSMTELRSQKYLALGLHDMMVGSKGLTVLIALN